MWFINREDMARRRKITTPSPINGYWQSPIKKPKNCLISKVPKQMQRHKKS